MLSCKQVTELVSARQDRILTRSERFGMFLHLLICSLCRRYKRQIDFIGRAARRLYAEADGDFSLSAPARRRIQAAINGSGHDPDEV